MACCCSREGVRMLDLGPTRYATTVDGLSVAYKRWGRGDRDLVLVPGTIWHSELIFECAPHRRLAERLGAIARVVCSTSAERVCPIDTWASGRSTTGFSTYRRSWTTPVSLTPRSLDYRKAGRWAHSS